MWTSNTWAKSGMQAVLGLATNVVNISFIIREGRLRYMCTVNIWHFLLYGKTTAGFLTFACILTTSKVITFLNSGYPQKWKGGLHYCAGASKTFRQLVSDYKQKWLGLWFTAAQNYTITWSKCDIYSLCEEILFSLHGFWHCFC